MIHQDICIKFTIGDRNYEAVGFLKGGERSVAGDAMLARTAGQNGGAIGEEDESFLRQHLEELPVELQPYWLATNKSYPGHPQYVSCFYFDGGRWRQRWYWLDSQWDDSDLVVRRCASES